VQTQHSVALPEWSLPLFFFGFAIFWCSICAFLSLLGGWYRLGKVFPRITQNPGKTFWGAAAAIGFGLFPVNYSGLFVRVGSEGIGLSVFFVFRVLHPPLLIPWQAIECRQETYWFRRCTAVYIANPRSRILFVGKVGRYIYEYWTTSVPLSNN
jgi:hypothetical protein